MNNNKTNYCECKEPKLKEKTSTIDKTSFGKIPDPPMCVKCGKRIPISNHHKSK
jgi:hypothetical protein